MKKSSSVGIVALAIFLALVSALYLSFNVVLPELTEAERQKTLAENCKNPGLPTEGEKNTVFDPEHGVVYVTFFQDGADKTVELPFKPSTDFEGCSDTAKEVLKDVKANYDEYIQQSCADFKAILEGKKRMEPKNGKLPNRKGAEEFVKEYCS